MHHQFHHSLEETDRGKQYKINMILTKEPIIKPTNEHLSTQLQTIVFFKYDHQNLV